MKYRVRLDLSFASQADAVSLTNYAKTMSSKAVSINEGKEEQEISFYDYEKCYHDETPNKPCEPIERKEIRKIEPMSL